MGIDPGFADPPEFADPASRRRNSSNGADEGKSILRIRIPYGLLRVLQISIIFLLSSAGATVSEARTKRFENPAVLAPYPPCNRAWPFDREKLRIGSRVSRKFLSTPFSTSD